MMIQKQVLKIQVDKQKKSRVKIYSYKPFFLTFKTHYRQLPSVVKTRAFTMIFRIWFIDEYIYILHTNTLKLHLIGKCLTQSRYLPINENVFELFFFL